MSNHHDAATELGAALLKIDALERELRNARKELAQTVEFYRPALAEAEKQAAKFRRDAEHVWSAGREMALEHASIRAEARAAAARIADDYAEELKHTSHADGLGMGFLAGERICREIADRIRLRALASGGEPKCICGHERIDHASGPCSRLKGKGSCSCFAFAEHEPTPAPTTEGRGSDGFPLRISGGMCRWCNAVGPLTADGVCSVCSAAYPIPKQIGAAPKAPEARAAFDANGSEVAE